MVSTANSYSITCFVPSQDQHIIPASIVPPLRNFSAKHAHDIRTRKLHSSNAAVSIAQHQPPL